MFTKKQKYLLKKHYFPILLILFLMYSLLLIFRSSFVIDGTRYFSLFDDMMISMRYAANAAHGHGLAWNAGSEPVAGLTNPLWTISMIPLHLLPISLAKTSFFVQLTGTLCMSAALFFVKKISDLLTNKSIFAGLMSVAFTAFYFPLVNWTTILGTEVSVLTLLLTVSVFMVIKQLQMKTLSLWLFVLLGIGTLTRIDFVIPAGIIILFLLLVDKKHRYKYITHGIPIFLALFLSQLLLMFWYYGDFLPNTYYLKMTGYPILPRITRGLYVGIRSMNWFIVVVPFLFTYITKSKQLSLLLALFGGQIVYSVYVGGDAWEHFGGANRYVAITIPLLFIALFTTFNAVKISFRHRLPDKLKQFRVAQGIVIALLFLILNTASDNMPLELLLIKPPLTVGENAFQVKMAQSLMSITKPDAKIGIVWAGITPYFADRNFIDVMGKNERHIAHTPAKTFEQNLGTFRKYVSFWPGHMKWDYQYVVTTYKPDIFGQVFPQEEKTKLLKEYDRYISPEGYEYYLRKGTKQLKLPENK